MTDEQQLFLSLLGDHINGTQNARIPADIDWELLYSYAKTQSLLGVCYCELKKIDVSVSSVPKEVMERFHSAFFNDVFLSVNQSAFMSVVSEKFQESGISFCPFKGWVVKKYWPVPELRTMGDVDILVHTEDRERTDSIMMDLGYQRYVDNHAVWTYFDKEILFELHDHMFYEHLTNDVDYQSYFDNAWKFFATELDESFHLLYLITHLAKHTVNKGMGFRAYLDLVLLCRNARSQLRWDWIMSELKRLKLLRFAETSFAFCRDWFGFEPPALVGDLDTDFFNLVTNKLFQDGTFGLENVQNVGAISAKEITHSKAPYLIGALRVTLSRLFPPYSDMQLIPWYSFVDGRPWLLPAAWVYRWGYCLFHKRKKGTELLLEPFEKKSLIEKRQQVIRDWGL